MALEKKNATLVSQAQWPEVASRKCVRSHQQPRALRVRPQNRSQINTRLSGRPSTPVCGPGWHLSHNSKTAVSTQQACCPLYLFPTSSSHRPEASFRQGPHWLCLANEPYSSSLVSFPLLSLPLLLCFCLYLLPSHCVALCLSLKGLLTALRK